MSYVVGPPVEPLHPKSIQADTPHTTLHELGVARGTRALWQTEGATRKTYFWPRPDEAPFAKITVANTWSDFIVSDGSENCVWQVPWLYRPKGIRTRFGVTLACDPAMPIQLRLVAQTLVTPIATIYGPASPLASNLPGAPPLAGAWAILAGSLGYNSFVDMGLSVINDEAAATRRVAIAMQARWGDSVWVDNEVEAATEIHVYLFSAVAEDHLC